MRNDDLENAAKAGDPEAQYNLGTRYNALNPGEYHQAIKWLTKAAEQGHAKAQHKLAHTYQIYGQAVDINKNKAEAFKWYKKAAEQGYAPSQYQLGEFYYYSFGVPQDGVKLGSRSSVINFIKQNQEEGIKWYKKAAAQGHQIAKKALELIEEE